MRGQEMWLLYTQMTRTSDPRVMDALIREVLDDAARRRIAVHPYCTVTREFMRKHPGYIALIPSAVRQRFRLAPQTAMDSRAGTSVVSPK